VKQHPRNKLRYCWRCRKKMGRGPGSQVCGYCQTYHRALGTAGNYLPRDDLDDRIAYYAARAAQRLDIFAVSPWARLPGGYQRSLERQTKRALATGRIAPTRKVEKLPE
jgi:hypothetical protein